MRAVRRLLSAVLFAVGALLAVYGSFLLVYRGEGRHPAATYVTLAGHRHDARTVGAIALAIGIAVGLAAILVLRARTRN